MTLTKTPIVGLTGGIGSGKSTIAKCFNALGILSVDADDVARQIVELGTPCLREIHQHFGDAILLDDGNLNRRALRNIIFDQPEEKAWLESKTHPAIREEIRSQLDSINTPYALLVHPLLFETQQDFLCNFIIAIDVSREIQLERVMKRDSTTRDNVIKIINSQLSNNDRLNRADFCLENTGNLAELNDKVIKLHQKILESLSC
ncbi:dephospho-CoA kinase [Marinomonas sp. CT5]|uniref:dephospho-CoA kinase n=1 Tax=Marinomonas sp. CT5 TaxID=2066133 RepID=UPI0017B0B5F7|nr:dephospho-CoA kinase [Marinomonas sp. CT5]NVK75612.1 dephospho-CoA kinase [Oceanospirillaceae bacterium]QUX95997.1 dephospho-CoA kinase [Marinomonas sp. CT5]